MKKRFWMVDGADGTGKTTQLQALRAKFEAAGVPTYCTRLLGGDGTDWVQNELRKILLSPAFPSDAVLDEERLFAAADLRGLRATRDWLRANPGGVALMDRALASHVCYALAKGLDESVVRMVHHEVRLAYHHLAEDFGSVSLVMVPEDERMAMERVLSRGEQITPRLENLRTQAAVIGHMRGYRHGDWASAVSANRWGPTVVERLVVVRREHGVAEVTAQIEAALREELEIWRV